MDNDARSRAAALREAAEVLDGDLDARNASGFALRLAAESALPPFAARTFEQLRNAVRVAMGGSDSIPEWLDVDGDDLAERLHRALPCPEKSDAECLMRMRQDVRIALENLRPDEHGDPSSIEDARAQLEGSLRRNKGRLS